MAHSDSTPAYSESTLARSSALQRSLQSEEQTLEVANSQTTSSKEVQQQANVLVRTKWPKQRKLFLKTLDDLHAGNDFIKDIVTTRGLTSIHNLVVVPIFDGAIPEDEAAVRDSF